jgi:sugar phosphate isomerase/epimerase
MESNRRQFLFTAAIAAGARRLPAAAPALRFPTAPRERIAVASYSLRAFIDSPRNRNRDPHARLFGLEEFPALVAERFKVSNVELLGDHLRSTEPAYLDRIRAAVRSAGSHVVNLPVGVGGSLYDPDSASRAAAVEKAKQWIDVAVALDCPGVRVHIQGVKGAAPDEVRAAASLGPVARYGESKGVVVTLENDDLVSEDTFFLAKVIDRVNSPWLRALPDFCNSALGGNEQFNYDAVAAMFRRAYNICHVKDSEVEGGKVFRIDLARTFGIAKAAGYKGYLSVEFEGEGDPMAGTAALVEQSLKYLA